MTALNLHAAFREYAIPFAVGSTEPSDFSDLQGLRAALGPHRVVLLGEHSHGDGAAFAVKSRLVAFLHQNLGFDVLALEAPIYDCMAAWQFVQATPYDPAPSLAALRVPCRQSGHDASRWRRS